MSTFFIVASVGFMLAFFMLHSHSEQSKKLARIERQIQAITAGPTFIQIHTIRRRNVTAIKIVKDATGLTLSDTATLLNDTPCRIPYVFTTTDAETVIAALTKIGVDASLDTPSHSNQAKSA